MPEGEAASASGDDTKRETFSMKRYGPIRFSTPFLLIWLSLFACSDAPRWTGSFEMRDGIEVISNPGAPLLSEAQNLMSELWEVQGPDWVDPTRVHARSGFITVVDPRANQIHMVSASGEIRASLGRPGGGPGEFLQLLDAFPDGDRLAVIDGGKGSVQYLDLDGNYLSSLYLEGQAWGGFPLGGGTLLVKGEFLSDPSAESFGDWVRIREGSEPSAFTARPLDPLPEEQGVRCSDFSSWAEGAARLRFTTPQIQVFHRDGGLFLESRIDLPVEVVSEAERYAALSELRRTLAARGLPPEFMQQSLVVMEERWRVKCRFGPLRFDPSGRFGAFLEQNPDEFGSGNATLHFVSQDGVYLAKVAFPTAWRDFDMDAGVVYALIRDPTTDVISLRAYRLGFPGSLLSDAAAAVEEARRTSIGET
jgi:hypothetical protein